MGQNVIGLAQPLSAAVVFGMLTIAVSGAYAQSFVGRTQNSVDSPYTNVIVPVPAGIQPGDVMLVFIASYNSTPTPPAGWTTLGSTTNANADIGAAFLRVYQAGDPGGFDFTNTNWPKAIMRVYRGVTGVDGSQFAASQDSGGDPSLVIRALPATTVADDAYIGFFISDNAPLVISGPGDLGDQTTDQTQWASFDGDKVVMTQGAVPPAEAASFSSGRGNWIGFGVTLGNNPQPPLLPYGNISPPSGQNWYVTLDDEFNQDSSISTSLWNGGADGGVPWCIASPYSNALGYVGAIGGSGTCDEFYGSAGVAPYVSVSPGVGLAVQPYSSYTCTNINGNCASWMGLQDYGLFSQRFGYFEIMAKMPTDNAGEGDGLHPDIWLVPVGRINFDGGSGSDEIDIAENDLGPATTASVHFSIAENGNEPVSFSYPNPSAGDLSSAFHRYAVYWQDDGNHGTVQLYFDGQPVGIPYTLTASLWDQGVYVFPGWMNQIFGSAFYGGATPDALTSNDNPLILQYVRVWQSH
jgi:Glycosyl hydrolases family 16